MIEIIEFKPINKGVLLSEVSIKIPKWGNFRIKRIKVFEKDLTRWFSLPSQEYEKEGKKKYFPLVDFETPEMNEAFRKKFFESYDAYISQSSGDKNIPF